MGQYAGQGQYATLLGGGLKTAGSVYGGLTRAKSADFSAALLDQEAGQSIASGASGLINENLRTAYISSAAQAGFAGSGQTSTSPTAVRIRGQIGGAGAYHALTALYQGEDRAAEIQARAIGMRDEASADRVSGWLSGMQNVLQMQNQFKKYWPPAAGPNTVSASGGLTAGGDQVYAGDSYDPNAAYA